MKKICVLLIAAMLFVLCGCGKNNINSDILSVTCAQEIKNDGSYYGIYQAYGRDHPDMAFGKDGYVYRIYVENNELVYKKGIKYTRVGNYYISVYNSGSSSTILYEIVEDGQIIIYQDTAFIKVA